MTHERNLGPLRTPRVRRAVAGLVCTEAIVVIGYGFVLGIEILVAKATSRAGAAFLALVVVVLGVAVGAVGVGVRRGQRWSRAPALVWQVLQLAVAVPAVPSRPLIGVPLVLLAGAVVVGLYLPGVIEESAG
jgi:hypothetical protein